MLGSITALPPDTPPALHEALAEARMRLADLYGERLRRVVLYGSRARGDARPDSDVDLLVVLDDVPSLYDEARRLGEVRAALNTRYGFSEGWAFSVKPYAEATFRDVRRPFVRNVRGDGIVL